LVTRSFVQRALNHVTPVNVAESRIAGVKFPLVRFTLVRFAPTN
jgi:hypothetical protein